MHAKQERELCFDPSLLEMVTTLNVKRFGGRLRPRDLCHWPGVVDIIGFPLAVLLILVNHKKRHTTDFNSLVETTKPTTRSTTPRFRVDMSHLSVAKVRLLKEVAWDGWEELATNIKYRGCICHFKLWNPLNVPLTIHLFAVD